MDSSDDELSISINNHESSNPSTSAMENSSNETLSVTVESELSTSPLFDGTFYRIVPEKCSNKKIVALCMKCPTQQQIEIKGYDKTTSNFVGHLKRKHGSSVVEEYKKYMKENKFKKNRRCNEASNKSTKTVKETPKLPITQKAFENNLVNFFTHSMIPLRTIEDTYFIKMMEDLTISNYAIKIPGRRSLRKKILKQSSDQFDDIKNKLSLAKYVCTTADIWSGKKRSFLGVTAHWIDTQSQRRSAAIACRRFKGAHTFDRIKDLLLEIFAEIDLDSRKVICSVTDNGSNFVKAFKIFGIKKTSLSEINTESDQESTSSDSENEFEAGPSSRHQNLEVLSTRQSNEIEDSLFIEDPIENFYSLPFHMRCNAHTLNLIASADTKSLLTDKKSSLGKMHLTVIDKCNELWSAAARPKSAEIMQNVLGHTLSRPGITRWNSLYDALKQILKIKGKYLHLARALEIKNPLKDGEFQYIEEYLLCAAPVADALDILQGDDTFYGILLPCLHALKKKLQNISRQNLRYCEELAMKYLLSVETRYEEFFNLKSETSKYAVIAALAYPRFKNKWLVCLSPADQIKCTNLFKSVVKSELLKSPELVADNLNISNNNSQKNDDFFDFSDSGSEAETIDFRKRADLIISNFFAEGSRETDLLERYPVIKEVFIKFNTPMPSSGSVERMFSFATMLNIPRSHKISDDLFEKRVIMKCNLNHLKN